MSREMAPKKSAIALNGRAVGSALDAGGLIDGACRPFSGGSDLPCWCRSGAWKVRASARRFRVLQCSGCGCYRIDPPPLQSPQQSENFYTTYYKTVGTDAVAIEKPDLSRAAGFWRVAERFPPLHRVGRRAADIGCGEGHLCAELKAAGWPWVAGIDVSQTRIERARKLYPDLTFFSQPLPATSVEQGSLDLIVMEAVIEHLPAPAAILEELCQYLVPGGRIVLTTPNMDSGEFRFLGKRWTGMLAPHAHIFLFTNSSIRRLVSEAGFIPESVGNYHTPLYTPLDYLKRMARGDLKGTIWRAHQEMGAIYGRMIKSSSMLFAVGRKPSE